VAKPKGQPDPDKDFKDLELGNEYRFFREHGAHDLGARNVDRKHLKVLSLKKGGREVVLLFGPVTHKPYQVDLLQDGKPEYSIRYLSYETDLPFQKSLFEPPAGVKITDAN
jgi:hypothetical protein